TSRLILSDVRQVWVALRHASQHLGSRSRRIASTYRPLAARAMATMSSPSSSRSISSFVTILPPCVPKIFLRDQRAQPPLDAVGARVLVQCVTCALDRSVDF